MSEMVSRHQRFSIGGMTSVADTAVIEDSVRRVGGVSDVSACFLRSTVEVEYAPRLSDDEIYITSDEVENTITDMGFTVRSLGGIADGNHIEKYDDVMSTAAQAHSRLAQENKRNRQKLFLTVLFSLLLGFPVLYMALMNVFDLPRIQMFYGTTHLMINAMAQFTLTSLVILLNTRFYKRGAMRLLFGKPSMDTLVMLGTGMALIYSIAGVYRMAYNWAMGNPLMVEELFRHLYFDSVCMILILLSAGQYFEAVAQSFTTRSISKLMGLAPHTAFVEHRGTIEEVYTRDVVVGDRIYVKAGKQNRIPVDGVIVEGAAVISEQSIIGVDLPVDKRAGSDVFAGTSIISGEIVMVA
ncbi:MAG: cation-translocating P-type ATPase, partial [Eggerthellaceae bacterium]|nr:cation-translocating P-type ATPase [Eggerthellaceae bacterium]